MKNREILRRILEDASHSLEKPDTGKAWNEVMARLNERLPEKRRKNRIPLIAIFTGGLLLVGIISYYYGRSTLSFEGQSLQSLEARKHGPLESNPPPTDFNAPVGVISDLGRSKNQSVKNINELNPGKYLKKRTEEELMDIIKGEKEHKNVFFTEENLFAGKPIIIFPLHIKNTFENIGEIQTLDSTSIKQHAYKPDKLYFRVIKLGIALGYGFNSNTAFEGGYGSNIGNYAYQVKKQVGAAIFGRIAITDKSSLQPEIGFEPYSTKLQVNYRTEHNTSLTRYNVKRLIFTHFALFHNYRIGNRTSIYMGAYYATRLPVYRSQKEEIVEQKYQPDLRLASSFNTDNYQKEEVIIRKYDIGMAGGIEYQIRNNWHIGVRYYRGLTDITTGSNKKNHLYSVSLRLAYNLSL